MSSRQANSTKNADLWIICPCREDVDLLQEIFSRWPEDKPASILTSTGTKKGFDLTAHLYVPEQIELIRSKSPLTINALGRKELNQTSPRAIALLGTTKSIPHLLLNSKKKNIPVLFFKAKLKSRQFARYLRLHKFWDFVGPEEVCSTSEKNAWRFSTLFPSSQVNTIKDISFDQCGLNSLIPYVQNPLSQYLRAQSQFLVFSHLGEDEEVPAIENIKNIQQQKPKTIVAVFPEDESRLNIWIDRLQKENLAWMKRSSLESQVPSGTVILWDVAGELDAAYALARGAFIGSNKSSSKKMENYLRPLQQGVTPCINAYMQECSWPAEEIFAQKLLAPVLNSAELENNLLECLKKAPNREKTREKFRNYLANAQGGTDLIVKRLLSYLA